MNNRASTSVWRRLTSFLALLVMLVALVSGTMIVFPGALVGASVRARPAMARRSPSWSRAARKSNGRAGFDEMLNPGAVAAFLQAQRAGEGNQAQAAGRYAAAVADARSLGRTHVEMAAGAGSPAWTSLGPTQIAGSSDGGQNSGRVTGLAVVSGSGGASDTVYLGAAGGGVWSAGITGTSTTWATHTDGQVDIAIGAVAVDPSDPSVVIAGTGEDNGCGDCYPGLGILESTDGGSTWNTSNPGGMFTGADVSSVLIEPGASSPSTTTVLVATSSGLFVSTDGGSTWAKEAGAGWTSGPVSAIVENPLTSPPTLYAAVVATGVEESTDNGASWTTLSGTGLPPSTSFGLTAIAVSPAASASSTTLYVSVGSGSGYVGMYKSTNGGASWTQLSLPAFTDQSYAYGSGTADQSWYDNVLAVQPGNPNVVVAGGITAIESTDGGATWYNLNGQNFDGSGTNLLHPDFHALTFDAAGNLYLGCDGGIWELDAAGVSSPGSVSASDYTNLNTNLDITQFYEDLGVYNNGALVLGGSQDNGTSLYSGTNPWSQVIGGDGGYSAINPLDSTQQFGEADGQLFMTSDSWSSSSSITPANAGAANFVPPMIIVPNASSVDAPTVYYGATDLWVTTDPAASSPTWTQLTTYGAGASTEVSAIAYANSNPSVLYVGFDNGELLVSTNATSGSPTFTTVASLGEWITHIAIDPSSSATVLVSESDSNVQDKLVNPQVEEITGATGASPVVTNVTGDLPSDVSSNSVVIDGSLYVVATDVGVFATSTLNGASTSWSQLGAGLPTVQVIGLSVDASGGIYAATHGRGVWELATPSKLAFTTEPPQSAVVGSNFTAQVSIEDASGNVVTSDNTDQVTLAITALAEASGAKLSCASNPVTVTSGVASFSCSINVAAGGYTLTASSGSLASATSSSFTVTAVTQPQPPPSTPPGYRFVASDGGIFSFGDAKFYGSMGGKRLNAPIVGMAEDPATGGYWFVASDGGIFSFNAPFYGSMGGKHLNAPIVGMASTPNGGGYWFVASDGGIFSFGNAKFYGSMGGKHLNAPIVGMAADPATGGYWFVASDGGIFSFNAPFLGSMGAKHLDAPIVGMASTPSGGGYWFVASDGGIFSFGNAPFHGSMGGKPLNARIVGMATN